MLLREICQGKFNFCNGKYDRHAVAVMVGEFYELLAQQILGATRLDQALASYLRNNLSHGYSHLPDLYCPERKIGWEVKGAQKRTAHPLKVEQLDDFKKLLAESDEFTRIEYVFFRYDTHEALSKKTADGMVDILTGKTNLMAIVDSSVVSSLAERARRWEMEYVLTGTTSDGMELWRIKQKFFDDLVSRPRETMEHLGIKPDFLFFAEPREETLTFFDREMRFKKIAVSVACNEEVSIK